MNGLAVFCGNGTLLSQCADAFRLAGGSVHGIITSDAKLRAWAEAEGHALLGTPEQPDVAGAACDYLFSVANLTVLPGALLSAARRMAINFHDGPLPARAGLNVPAWAMMEGETSHEITWHEMTGKVDAGGILATRRFAILPTDTAFSLNARCYEAALDAFQDILDQLSAGTLTPRPQVGSGAWFARAKRPLRLGTLDFNQPAEVLARTVRALDFGTYANPLALPKIWTGQQLLSVRTAEVVDIGQGAPGTILAADRETLTVRAGDGSLRLSGLSDGRGEPVAPSGIGLAAGLVLPGLAAIASPEADAAGRDEQHWQRALAAATGAALPPYPMAHATRESGTETAALDLAEREPARVAAAWAAWVAGLTGRTGVTLALRDAGPRAPWLSTLRPVAVDTAAHATPEDLTNALTAAVASAADRVPMAADLPLRLAPPEARQTALQALSVAIAATGADAEVLGDGALTIALDPPRLVSRAGLFADGVLQAIASHFSVFAEQYRQNPSRPLSQIPLGPVAPLGRSGDSYRQDIGIAQAIAEVAARTPDAPALEAGKVRLTFAELDGRAAALAGALSARGAAPGAVVGLCLERSADLVVAMLAILRTGAGYLPLDPAYPADRIAYMIEDAEVPLIVASPSAASRLGLDPARTIDPSATGTAPASVQGGPDDLAYLIYTSGSTGKPKGVMVDHRNVMNFFAGMDEAVPLTNTSRLLAVTSVSFDISVLEILWTLSRGATLVLQTDGAGESEVPDFSLFYFASEAAGNGHHAYRLLLEGARFADENGFSAIWTPERHFHAFGGLYPNPAISSAAVAGITKNIKIRAGSSVVPLHHPVRLAEDWALVDNLSNGRAGMALASGWQPNDFIVRPDAFADRKNIMIETATTLRKLWRGEKMEFPGHDGKPVAVEIHPKPMQKDIPLWLTAAGNPETFAAAAKLGCGVLTHLLGQTFEEVAEKIRAYRVAWREAGHEGSGNVVLMLHTFVGETEEEVRAAARGPMKSYLKSAVDLVKRASWTFPTIVRRAEAKGVTPAEMFEKEELSAEDLDQLLEHAFERYYRTSGLFGTPESAKEIVRRVAEIGVDEVACLIDFGINTDLVLRNLPHLKTLMDGLARDGGVTRKASVAEEIVERNITHLQCTPSMASMLAADGPGKAALGRLDCLMVGGEALPLDLAQALRAALKGTFLNMYGPTETTIWSSVATLDRIDGFVPLGRPIANTMLGVRAPDGRELPPLAEGELWIGGAGVTRGYRNRAELTAERFVGTGADRFYRTGDLVRRRADGALEFLGRIDNQVKIRGHRIELGEIEAALADLPEVRQAVVKAVEFSAGDTRLVGYVVGTGAARDPAALRAALAARLPEIMVPSQIVLLDRMPVTPNGKIDRKALPAPFAAAEAAQTAPAEGATEEIIARIWREALGLPAVSATSNFFDLGGHSLLVVQVQRQLKAELKRDVAITDLFRFPTIRSLAGHLSDAGEESEAPNAASRGAARAAARLARLGRR